MVDWCVVFGPKAALGYLISFDSVCWLVNKIAKILQIKITNRCYFYLAIMYFCQIQEKPVIEAGF